MEKVMILELIFVKSAAPLPEVLGQLVVDTLYTPGILHTYNLVDPNGFLREFLKGHCRFLDQGVLGCAIARLLQDQGLQTDAPPLSVLRVRSSSIEGIEISYHGDSPFVGLR